MLEGLVTVRKTLKIIAAWTFVFSLCGTAYAQSAQVQQTVPEEKTDQKIDATAKTEAFKEAIQQERDRVRRRIEMIRMWGLVSELNLDQKTANALFPVIKEFQKRRQNLSTEIHQTKMQLAASVSKSGASDEQVKNLIAKLRHLIDAHNRLIMEEFDKLSTILNPKQQVQYILFGDRFNRELQVIIRQVINQSGNKDSAAAASEPVSAK
jgi:hypothetical protein